MLSVLKPKAKLMTNARGVSAEVNSFIGSKLGIEVAEAGSLGYV
jgi:hypothetical protein